MLIQPVHPDHPSTDRDREPKVTAGPKLRGKAGAMPNRVRMMPPAHQALCLGSPLTGVGGYLITYR
jgi:hypothetical protein